MLEGYRIGKKDLGIIIIVMKLDRGIGISF